MTRALIPAVALLLAACEPIGRVLDPDVAQLARYQEAASRGDHAAIADEPVVPCTAGSPACARLHAIRAEACLLRAMAARAPGAFCPAPTAASDLACADQNYKAALAMAEGFTAADRAAHRRGLVQALLCRAESGTVAAGVAPAREALALAAGLAPPEREAMSAAAALFLARPGAGADSARCAHARDALRHARAGLETAPYDATAPLLRRLAADAALRRATIPGCAP